MVLAELEVWHSRPIAPTRRIALGDSYLPVDPVPGPGGLLLGAVVARFIEDLDRDLRDEMQVLMSEVERGRRIGQPQMRHRLQDDRVGLSRSRHRLVAGVDGLRFEFETSKGLPAQSALAAVYGCGQLPLKDRPAVMEVMRRGAEWVGPVGPGLIDHLVGRDVAMRFRSGSYETASDPMIWAMGILELDGEDLASKDIAAKEVQRSYRRLLRDAHPDHGAGEDEAADRIAELSKAREILLSS